MMAVDLHCVEELLFRSLFLADNNNNEEEEAVDSIILSNTNGSTHRANDFDVLNNNGIELSTLGSSSASSSEQASSTAETETDEDDDYIAELTRQMAHYMFQEDDKMDKSWELRSNHGTPKWPSQEPISPPNMPTCDEVMRKLEQLNLNNEVSKNSQAQKFQSMSPKPSSTPISLENPSVGFCSSNQALVDQIRAIQFYKMKQEQVLKQQGSANKESQQQHDLLQKKNRAYSANSNGARPYGFSSTPWSNQQVGSGMRAVFLGGSSSTGTGSSGTGVFLPCAIGNSSNNNSKTIQNQSRKKRGCSPVLIPAKVLQALKVHFDRVGYQLSELPEPSSTFATATLQHDNQRVGRTSTTGKCPDKKRHSREVPAMNHTEICLPQEWTY